MLGKGGTGKTTLATLLSLYAANAGQRVLLISLDPAHNLSDIFEKRVGSRPTAVAPGLKAMEADMDFWIDQYLKETARSVKQNYQYLTAFNLEKYFDLYRSSPGMEAFGLFSAYRDLTVNRDSNGPIIFDMPPTGLSIQFFKLPDLSIQWLQKLRSLRTEILEKQKIITRVKSGKISFEQDKPLARIVERLEEFGTITENFRNSILNAYFIICNPDRLSLSEAEDIAARFREWQYPVTRLIVNRSDAFSLSGNLPETIANLKAVHLPDAERPLTGLKNLNEFLTENNRVFGELLPVITG
jgi:arsenite-transporting ATPase